MADPKDTPDGTTSIWTIKGVSNEARNAATSAAERDGLRMGEWLSRAILRAIQADRASGGLQIQKEKQLVMRSDDAADRQTSRTDALANVERMVAMAASMAAASGAPPPKRFQRQVFRHLSDAMAEMNPPAKSARWAPGQTKSPESQTQEEIQSDPQLEPARPPAPKATANWTVRSRKKPTPKLAAKRS